MVILRARACKRLCLTPNGLSLVRRSVRFHMNFEDELGALNFEISKAVKENKQTLEFGAVPKRQKCAKCGPIIMFAEKVMIWRCKKTVN